MATETFKNAMLEVIPSLRAFAASLVGNPANADDLVQETLTKAWNKSHTFEEGTNIKAWLFTILRNEFYSQIRKRKREVEDAEGTFEASLSIDAGQTSYMDMQDLMRALDELPKEQREALILVGASGFAYEEAADIIGCAVGTVKSRVSRARSQLSASMGIDANESVGPNHMFSHLVKRPAA